MTDTELILQRLDGIQNQIGHLEERFDKLEARFDKLEKRIEVLEVRMDKLEARFDRLEAKVDNLEKRIDNLEEKVDNLEIGLDGEIQKVFEVTLKNKEDIQLLLLYRDRIINVSNTVTRFDGLEERQRLTEEVVAAHSEDIRMLKNMLA